MNYRDYYESIKEIEISKTRQYYFGVRRNLHRRYPFGLVSSGGCSDKVIRVPHFVGCINDSLIPVTAVSPFAFSGNKTITDIILPSNIREISKGAFSGCKSLRNITLPKSIKRIEEKTFEGCASLENVYYEGSPEEWDQISILYEKYEIDFGELIPGTPVQKKLDERRVFIPGNEALKKATIHFNCDFQSTIDCANVMTGIDDEIEEVRYTVDRIDKE